MWLPDPVQLFACLEMLKANCAVTSMPLVQVCTGTRFGLPALLLGGNKELLIDACVGLAQSLR